MERDYEDGPGMTQLITNFLTHTDRSSDIHLELGRGAVRNTDIQSQRHRSTHTYTQRQVYVYVQEEIVQSTERDVHSLGSPVMP